MKFTFSALLSLFSLIVFSQSNSIPSSELYEDIQRFATTETVMYLAAHPDDENTRLISWLTNKKHLNTVYLSLTRGDGGQNLIGTEKGPLLGLLRTQELLEARAVDGGKQWFTRANDFGYSKTATETFTIWDKQKILADVVWAIRKHQPQVIITRFHPDSNGDTHGHHTASAILAMEAFDLAGDSTAFPEQLKYVDTWQPARLFFNTSWWFYGSREAFEEARKTNMISVDVGSYFPTLGLSNNEIAALSRSKHACQGFGAELQRGSETEWLELLKGNMAENGKLIQHSAKANAFLPIQKQTKKLLTKFNFQEPSAIVPDLIAIAKQLDQLPDSKLKQRKRAELYQLILHANGVYTEWTTPEPYAVNGDEITGELEVTNRGVPIQFKSPFLSETESYKLAYNESFHERLPLIIKSDSISSPYWLNEPVHGISRYTVNEQENIGLPEQEATIQTQIVFEINDYQFTVDIPLQHKFINPAKGEIYEPLYVVPPVAVNIPNAVYLFSENEPQEITVSVTNFADSASGTVELDAGLEWMISKRKAYEISKKGGTQELTFRVIPPKNQTASELRAAVSYHDSTYFKSFEVVDYSHIKKQFVFQRAKSVIQKVNMTVPDVSIGYIQGTGDDVPQSLRQVGLDVTELTEKDWNLQSIQQFDVVILGIRLFNTPNNQLPFFTNDLWEFAKGGGLVISQYNTNRSLVTDRIAPYNLRLSRDRISEEDAALTILQDDHPLVNKPNKITQTDFDGWTQERGLYFADEWGEEFTPILAGNDKGEKTKKGMLLVADVGEGHYVYTGLSFFRELPAGVPGAYRLFMNILGLQSAGSPVKLSDE